MDSPSLYGKWQFGVRKAELDKLISDIKEKKIKVSGSKVAPCEDNTGTNDQLNSTTTRKVESVRSETALELEQQVHFEKHRDSTQILIDDLTEHYGIPHVDISNLSREEALLALKKIAETAGLTVKNGRFKQLQDLILNWTDLKRTTVSEVLKQIKPLYKS